jgi:hypothetical protein
MLNAAYAEKIKALPEGRVRELCQVAQSFLPFSSQKEPWRAQTNRGKALLCSEYELNAYLAAYGRWHRMKLCSVLPALPQEMLREPFTVIDWGCGQGIGFLSLCEYMLYYGFPLENCRNVTLIDPSAPAVARAELHASKRIAPSKIRSFKQYFHECTAQQLDCGNDYPVLHLFSNVLDIRGIDLADLAEKIYALHKGKSYMLITSPHYTQAVTTIGSFLSFFNKARVQTFEKRHKLAMHDYTMYAAMLDLSEAKQNPPPQEDQASCSPTEYQQQPVTKPSPSSFTHSKKINTPTKENIFSALAVFIKNLFHKA